MTNEDRASLIEKMDALQTKAKDVDSKTLVGAKTRGELVDACEGAPLGIAVALGNQDYALERVESAAKRCDCSGDHDPRSCASSQGLCKTFRGYYEGSGLGRICGAVDGHLGPCFEEDP